MIKYVIEYNTTTKEVVKGMIYNADSVPTITPGSGNSIKEVEVTGSTTQAEIDDLTEAVHKNPDHKVMSSAVKKKDPLFPDALTSSAGFTPAAALADFQEDGGPATATDNNTDTSCHVTMPTPVKKPTTGSGEQVIEVTCGQFDTGQTGTPTLRIEVWENGEASALATSSEMNVTAAEEVLTLTWDATSLVTDTGANVEIKVFGTKSGGAPSARNSVNIGQVCWRVLRDTNV